MATFTFTVPTEQTKTFFKKDTWYKGSNGDKGIITKFSGNHESNHGWWSGLFVKNYFRLISPEFWTEVTDHHEIEQLNQKLEIELKDPDVSR